MYNHSQQRALKPEHSVWLSASAGTGKTEVLTGRVLRLLLEGVPPSKILSVTFTNAAAAEMASRIRAKIAAWVKLDDEPLTKDLSGILGRKAGAQDIINARSLFAKVVDRPDALRIQTLHGFCQSLLTQFPLEAGISPGFRVLDEEETKQLRKTVLAKTIQQPGLKESVALLATQLQDYEIRKLIAEACQMQKKLRPLLPMMQQKIHKKLNIKAGSTIEFYDDSVLHALAVAWGSSESKEELERGSRLQEWFSLPPEERLEKWADYILVFCTQKNESRQKLCVAATNKKYPGLESLAREAQLQAMQILEQISANETYHRTSLLIQFLQVFFDLLDAEKKEAQILDYDDLIMKAKDLLQSQEASAWVRYKLEGGIEHLLIDEAQDTSPEQWSVLEALYEDFFAGEGSSLLRRTVFVVGDPKQSIYRFQGADMTLFEGQFSSFQARAEAAQKPFTPETLSLSYRSTESVLRLVDGVLLHPTVTTRLGATIHPKHDLHRKDQAGQVVLWPILEEEKEEKPEGWVLPDNRQPPPDPQHKLVVAIADTVANWLQEKRLLEAKGRPIEAGDILILMRERGVLMERLVRALKVRGVPVAGVDRLKLKQSLWVKDLLALAQFLLLPADDFSLACILKSPLLNLNEDDLYQLSHARGETTLWQRLQDSMHQEAAARLKEYLRLTDFLPPYELFLHILNDGALEQAVARMGEEVREITKAFLDQALEYESEHTASLEGFLGWMNEREVEVVRTPELAGNKLRVMTIHSAKGLQAPVVILADAARSRNTQSQRAALYFDEEEEYMLWLQDLLPKVGKELKDREKKSNEAEDARKLYVALTRAADELYITGWHPLANRDDWWATTIAEVMDKEHAETISAPAPFCGAAKRLYNPQLEVVKTTTAKDKATAKNAAPEFLSRPAPKEEVIRTTSVIGSAAADTEALAYGITVHRQLETLSPEVAHIIHHPDFVKYFDARYSVAEVTIQSGEFSGRIDRLVVLPEEVIVLDFKTGKVPSEIPENYRQQMQTYRTLLAPLYPGKPIRAGLLYITTPEILWLDFGESRT